MAMEVSSIDSKWFSSYMSWWRRPSGWMPRLSAPQPFVSWPSSGMFCTVFVATESFFFCETHHFFARNIQTQNCWADRKSLSFNLQPFVKWIFECFDSKQLAFFRKKNIYIYICLYFVYWPIIYPSQHGSTSIHVPSPFFSISCFLNLLSQPKLPNRCKSWNQTQRTHETGRYLPAHWSSLISIGFSCI